MPWLKNRRLWWTAFFLLLCTVAGQAYMTVPRTVLTHEMMAKLNDPREVRLIFVGDTGSGQAHQLSVARQMEELCQSVQPAAVVMLGDNFYHEGVQTVDDPLWQERFEQVYTGACLDQLSFYAILGNHDYRGSADAQIAYSQAGSGKWMMPARYYSLRFGEILELGAIDSNIPDQCGIASVYRLDPSAVEKIECRMESSDRSPPDALRWKVQKAQMARADDFAELILPFRSVGLYQWT
jgi:hypothetical protein